MKDEIIKNIRYRLDCKSPTAYDGIELSKEESNLLLDYITNLEKENENRISESLSYDLAVARIKELEQENYRYKKMFEGKEKFIKTMPEGTDFIILSKADYDRQQKDIELELIDYKSRNEKAIEYIKEKAINNCWIDQYEANDLLNILQGGDE